MFADGNEEEDPGKVADGTHVGVQCREQSKDVAVLGLVGHDDGPNSRSKTRRQKEN